MVSNTRAELFRALASHTAFVFVATTSWPEGEISTPVSTRDTGVQYNVLMMPSNACNLAVISYVS